MTVVCFNAVASEPRPLTAWLLHIEQWNGKYIWGWLCSASDCCLGLQTRGFGGAHNHDHTSQTTLCLYCLSLDSCHHEVLDVTLWTSIHSSNCLSSSSCSIRVSAVVKISHLPGLSVASAPLPPPSRPLQPLLSLLEFSNCDIDAYLFPINKGKHRTAALCSLYYASGPLAPSTFTEYCTSISKLAATTPHTQHIHTKTVAWHRSNVTLNIATGLERSFCPCFTEYRQI